MDQSVNTHEVKRPHLRAGILVGVAVVAVASRLMPHPWNLSPVAAMTMFCGAAFLGRRAALLTPLAAIFASDVLLSLVLPNTPLFHPAMAAVYACYVLNVMVGRWLSTRRRDPVDVAVAVLFCSVTFFVVTNVAVWWSYMNHNALDLAACFAGAIPFFQNSLLGNAVFATVFFGGFAIAESRVPELQSDTALRASAI
ncbi:MAG: hypothetical protein O3A00_09775 [Planctomycetota bacterium]|nr:hypothetical protein [Planctomycetota bacterium]